MLKNFFQLAIASAHIAFLSTLCFAQGVTVTITPEVGNPQGAPNPRWLFTVEFQNGAVTNGSTEGPYFVDHFQIFTSNVGAIDPTNDSCMFEYTNRNTEPRFHIFADTPYIQQAFGPWTDWSSGISENSQCRVWAQDATRTTPQQGPNLIVRFYVEGTSLMEGDYGVRISYGNWYSNWSSGWGNFANYAIWTPRSTLPNPPTKTVSVVSQGSQGATFDVSMSSSGGAGNGVRAITRALLIVNTTNLADGQNACYAIYHRTSRELLLIDSTGNVGLGARLLGTSPGASSTFSSLNCTMDMGQAWFSETFSTHRIVVPTVFSNDFINRPGVKNVFFIPINRPGNGPLDVNPDQTWPTSPVPAVSISNNTNSAAFPNFFTSDSYTISIAGSSWLGNRPVTLVAAINGVAQPSVVLGSTDSGGNFQYTGVHTSAGNVVEQVYVGSVGATPTLSFYVIAAAPGYDISTSPPSLPGSFTAPAPVIKCDNISGSWKQSDNFGNDIGLEVQQQSASSISGTVNAVSLRITSGGFTINCGQFQYTNVTGQYDSTADEFTLNVSNPVPSLDGCGLPLLPSYVDKIKLSGASCSSGNGIASTSASSGSPGTFRALVTSTTANAPQVASTLTSETPKYVVQYAAYIPVDHVSAPTPCLLNSVPKAKIYLGDAFRSSFRATQSVLAIPFATTGISTNAVKNTGATRSYGVGSPVNGSTLSTSPASSNIYDGPYIGADEDQVSDDCALWHQKGRATSIDMQTPSTSFSVQNLSTTLSGKVDNPNEQSAPGSGIKWNMSVNINSAIGNATIAYNHTCYPAHILKINGTVVYSYLPPQNDTFYIFKCLFTPFFPVIGVTSPVAVPSK